MIKVILCDFARVILFPKDKMYTGRLDKLHEALSAKQRTYNSFDYFELNEELLKYFQTIKHKVSLNIFTTGLNHEVSDVKKRLTPIFDHMFYTGDFGMSKKDPNTYVLMSEKLHLKPEEVMFIDDILEHVQAAKKVGLQAIHYINNEKLLMELQPFL